MASLKFILGMFPPTAKIEAEEAALIKDYNDFNEYTDSKELKRYEELDKMINTSDFDQKRKSIKAQKFNQTEEYRKLQEYLRMKKAKHIRDYYKTKASKEFADYQRIDGSEELKKYEKLAEYINSKDFSNDRQQAGKDFKNTAAYGKEQEYLRLQKSPSIRSYFKFKISPLLENYKRLDGSEELAKYEDLEKFVNSEEFMKVKNFMALSPQKKYEQSDEYRLEQEYVVLKKSEKINWYFRLKKDNDFCKITDWEMTFEDDFKETKLNPRKWMNNYFWGDAILKDTYSLPGDKHLNTPGRNIELKDSVLRITTRKENAEGKIWNPLLGFQKQQFNYTSGLVSTGKGFRQKYGVFKAKVRFSNTPVRQAIWMIADKILPHVDIAKLEKNKIHVGNFWGNINEKGGTNKKTYKKGGSKFSTDYFIYTLEWTPDKLVWKVNGLEAMIQAQGVPQDPMYIGFSAGIADPVPDHMLPASMDIDWVRVYKKKE
jgi:beta-glucanase (GH16 family)